MLTKLKSPPTDTDVRNKVTQLGREWGFDDFGETLSFLIDRYKSNITVSLSFKPENEDDLRVVDDTVDFPTAEEYAKELDKRELEVRRDINKGVSRGYSDVGSLMKALEK